MPSLRNLLLWSLLTLIPAVAFAQASPEPLGSLGAPASDLSRMTRDKETGEKFFNKTMATLNLVYQSSGDLRSSLVKTELNSLFMTIEVNGAKVKNVAKTEKPKVQEAVQAGTMEVKGRWARPGTRLQTKCSGELAVGLHKIVFLPYGGTDRFSCHVEVRHLSEEAYAGWQASLDTDQAGASGNCDTQHTRGSAEFWSCIDSADVPFPQV